jgi:hypothetical protein
MLKTFRFTKKLFTFLIIFLFLLFLLSRGCVPQKEEVKYGVTFSARQAKDLGLDPKEVFHEMLYDLGARKLRLSAYWDEIEKSKGEFSWEKIDWQLGAASQVNSEIILSVGGRLPRWPECHFPDWAEKLSEKEREAEILRYIEATVLRYRDNDNIVAWQVENEPFLSHFGDCPELNPDFLDKEIALVKSLDDRPVIVTDSGELSLWVPAAKRADIFGTTMYKNTYSNLLQSYVHYPIEPGFFRFKKNIARLFADPQEWIVIELQGEPWGPIPFQNLSKEERDKTMNLEKLIEISDFARRAGFDKLYFWGVEWWYWEKETQNNPALWNYTKTLFQD